MTAPDLTAHYRDGLQVIEGFLSPADCDALQARAAELVAGWDRSARTAFSTRDQSHARDRYFRASCGAIRFFVEEEAPEHLNKIGHALHDLDPVFDRVSRQPCLAELAPGSALSGRSCCSRSISSSSRESGGKWAGIKMRLTCAPSRRP